MRFTAATVILASAVFGISSAQFSYMLEEMVTEVNGNLDNHITNLKYAFDMWTYNRWSYLSFMSTVQSASDVKAKDHVYRSRSNYTVVLDGVTAIMNGTRDGVIEDVQTKQAQLRAKLPNMELIATDLARILRDRKCPISRTNAFFDELFSGLKMNIDATLEQVSQAYMNMLYREFVPTYMVAFLFEKLQACIYEPAALTCILKVEDFYLSPAVNMIKDAANLLSNFIINSNYRLGQALSSEIDHNMVHAYQTVFKYDCNPSTTTTFTWTPSPAPTTPTTPTPTPR